MKKATLQLPLHGGKVPRWLFQRMKKLTLAICATMVEEHGAKEFLDKLAAPFWFQGFGSVLGFDWHSSGVTTVVCGAIKEALRIARALMYENPKRLYKLKV